MPPHLLFVKIYILLEKKNYKFFFIRLPTTLANLNFCCLLFNRHEIVELQVDSLFENAFIAICSFCPHLSRDQRN